MNKRGRHRASHPRRGRKGPAVTDGVGFDGVSVAKTGTATGTSQRKLLHG